MATTAVPASDLVLAAMGRAVAYRVAGYRGDERYDRYTLAALKERVVAVPCQPRPRRDGWWAIGTILDDLAGLEWRVWMHPQDRTVRMAPHRIPELEIPTPTRRPDGRYYDGARRRWVDPAAETTAEAAWEDGRAPATATPPSEAAGIG